MSARTSLIFVAVSAAGALSLGGVGHALAQGVVSDAYAPEGYYQTSDYPTADPGYSYSSSYTTTYADPYASGGSYVPAAVAPAPVSYSTPPTTVDEFTVYGGYGNRDRPVVGYSRTTGAPIELVTARRHVGYGDLDLRTEWGADTLRNRVKAAASSACRELDFTAPLPTQDNPPCYSTAVNDGLYQAESAIATARGW